jgi:hypothetical protein
MLPERSGSASVTWGMRGVRSRRPWSARTFLEHGMTTVVLWLGLIGAALLALEPI